MRTPIEKFKARAINHLKKSAELKLNTMEECIQAIMAAAETLAFTVKSGNKILLCGNGGSAADCQHTAAELVSLMEKSFPRSPLPAIALTTDTSFITAFANDFGFDGVFERQVMALGRQGDVLIGISTSGNSTNILRAIQSANKLGLKTIGLTGAGGQMQSLVTTCIRVPSLNTQYIQETHLAIEHILCDLIECILFNKADKHS